MKSPPLLDEAALDRRIREIALAIAREETHASEDWIDQGHSPLGRRVHCLLVRRGELPGVRIHRRVLVRRRDLDRYIESHGTKPAAVANDSDPETIALARVGARRVSK